MKPEQLGQLMAAYEDLFHESSRRTQWLLRSNKGKKFQFAVHEDMFERMLYKLDDIHRKLFEFSGYPWPFDLFQSLDLDE